MGQKYILVGGNKSKMTQVVMNKVDFGTPYKGNLSDRKLLPTELVRALRFSIAAEYEAIQLYTQLAESTIDNPDVVKVFEDIAREEKVHVGEFMALLKKLDPDEQVAYEEGEEEIKDIVGKCLKGK
jgi:rubrerythrin